MTAPSVKFLIDLFQTNQNVLRKQLEGITQTESLLQPPFRGNCLNWVVGHILDSRDGCLSMLSLPGNLSEAEAKTYGYGSEGLTDGARASDLSSLLARLDASLVVLVDKLNTLSPADLEREVEIWRGPTPLAQALFLMQWHESYHTGQLELLRQLAGKNDHII